MNPIERYYSERKAAIVLDISRESLRKYRALSLIRPLAIAHVVLYPSSTLDEFKRTYIVRKGVAIKLRKGAVA